MKLFKWIYDILFTTRLIRSNIIVCDIDKTIGYIKPSSFEDDGDLEKWKRDNTLWNNLFQFVKLPTLSGIQEMYANGDLIVLMTSRERTWWLPFVLWWHGIKYDFLSMYPTEKRDIRDANHVEEAGKYKAEVYKNSNARFFMESEKAEGVVIRKISNKLVILPNDGIFI